MDIVTIDFETYYDKEYSLKKLTTEKYIRDPRFEVIGVGVKINSHECDWYSGSDPETFLRSLDYSDKAILCHNTAFDGAILSWKFGIKPRLWLDTLSIARPFHGLDVGGSLKALSEHYGIGKKGDEVINALGKRRSDFTAQEMARYADYCIQDVNVTTKLYHLIVEQNTAESALRLEHDFAIAIETAAKSLETPGVKKHLEFQIEYANQYYNWNKQGNAWTRFIEGALNARRK